MTKNQNFANQFASLVDYIQSIKEVDISFSKNGEGRTLEGAESRKNALADYVLWLLSDSVSGAEDLNPLYLESKLESANVAKKTIDELIQQTQRLGGSGNSSNYESRRQEFLRRLNEFRVDDDGRLAEFRMTLSSQNALRAVSKAQIPTKSAQITKELAAAKEASKEVSDILKTLRSEVEETKKMKERETYAKLSSRHGVQEKGWFWAMIFCAFLLGAGLFAVVFYHGELRSFSVFPFESPIPAAIRQSLLIGTLLLLLRLTFTRYNAERQLHTLYDHRRAAIEHLDIFLANLAPEHRSSLNHDAAKMLLADPDSIANNHGSPTEVNISPRISPS